MAIDILCLVIVCCIFVQTDCSRSHVAVSIHPTDQTYWSDSRIQLTCKTQHNVHTEDCFWFVNNNKINSSDSSYHINPHSCSITVKVASVAASGEWKCKLFPAGEGRPPVSASTRITVLRLTLREFVFIFIGLLVLVTMLVVIGLLLLKIRRLSDNLTSLSGRNQQYIYSSAGQSTDDCTSCTGTPPPSYNVAVGERILAGECARMEFARFLHEIQDAPSAPRQSELVP